MKGNLQIIVNPEPQQIPDKKGNQSDKSKSKKKKARTRTKSPKKCTSEEEKDTEVGTKKACKCKKGRKDKKDKKDKKDYSSEEEVKKPKKEKKEKKVKEEGLLPPRKALKRLIERELERQTPDIFMTIMKSKELGSPVKKEDLAEAGITTHTGVCCDSCGMKDMIGIRYKCSICPDFDFCELCEERVSHPHPFIKILSPDSVPTSIFVIPQETTQESQQEQ